ncbi:unnamed protein product [Peniophora sp. CBMAI 1063]|nr:unnamed protein product [Peniophora sp. CBMAI 1063]
MLDINDFIGLTSFELVRDLVLADQAAVELWGGITGNPVHDWQHAVAPCQPFPILAHIYIIDFDFIRWPGTIVVETKIPECFSECFSSLLADAFALKDAYLPLKTFEYVVFRRCKMDGDQVEIFRQKLGPGRVRLEPDA